jgi:hypothetical protein
MPLSAGKTGSITAFGGIPAKVNNTEKVKKGVDMIVSFRDKIPAAYKAS